MRPTDLPYAVLFFAAHAASIAGVLALMRRVERRTVNDDGKVLVHVFLWHGWLIGEVCGWAGMYRVYALLARWGLRLPVEAENLGLCLAGPVAAFLGAAAVYVYFRARDRHDPDYGAMSGEETDDRAWPPRTRLR